MKTRKEIKLRLLIDIENISRYKKEDAPTSTIDLRFATVEAYKKVLKMLGCTWMQINESDTRLKEIERLKGERGV